MELIPEGVDASNSDHEALVGDLLLITLTRELHQLLALAARPHGKKLLPEGNEAYLASIVHWSSQVAVSRADRVAFSSRSI